MLAYVFAMRPFGRIGWLAAFLFAACGALRLARFNVQSKKFDKRYFVGLPIPAAAGVIASAVLFLGDEPSLKILEVQVLSAEVTSALIVVLVAATAFLMVSKVRYRSLKEIDIARRRPFTILVSLLLAMVIIFSEPSLLLFGLFFLYTLSGFLRYLPFGRRRVLPGEELELTPGEPRSP
jgi:CDP-diacylglycerol--serine O-phosphatidyltransferase